MIVAAVGTATLMTRVLLSGLNGATDDSGRSNSGGSALLQCFALREISAVNALFYGITYMKTDI